MRLGLCCNPAEGPAALSAGYDYVEYPASSNEPSETTNLFFPAGATTYAPYPTYNVQAVELGMGIIDAAASRGVEIMVIGSGAARRAPEGVPMPEWSFYRLVKILDDYAQRYGIRIAPESLNPKETNVAISLPEMALTLNAKGIPYTADSYHALEEANTPDGGINFWREQIPLKPAHVHFAPYGRPVPSGDEASLRTFFARLRELGYDDRASLECRRDGIPDPAPLRRLFE